MTDPSYTPDRRPIAARHNPISIRTALWLARVGASPNGISAAGMVAGILGGLAFAATTWFDQRIWFLAAAACMQCRLLANMFDGMVALQTGRASPVGELFNEVPDRISDAAILVGAGYALGSCPELGYWAAILAIFTAYVRAQGRVAGAHQEFCGPMAKQQRMAVLTCAALYAGLAPTAWQPTFQAFEPFGIVAISLAVIVAGSAFTSVRRLSKIATALRQKPA
jgi:phosphatidylglycerophosphate synthase